MKHLLASTSFLVVNKHLSCKLGLKPAVLLADLISKEQYFIDKGQCIDGWFFNSADNIKIDTTLTRHEQTKAIKKLEEYGLIETKLKGLPAVKHFKIIESKILNFLQTRLKENTKLVSKEFKVNKNTIIKKSNNISILKEEVENFDTTKDLKQEFLDYWLEPSKSGKTRFEMQKTWDTSRRLKTWIKNANNWYKQNNTSKLSKNLQTLKNVKQRLKNYDL